MTDSQSKTAGSELLLPCPFCGSSDGPQVWANHRVVCGGCDAEGPSLHDALEANLTAWNRRATLSHPATQAGALQAVGVKVHEESAISIHATLYAPVLKEFCLEASREDEGRNWYIEMTDESGYHTYDGYWRDSDRKTCAEVLAEAADGSMLHELTPLPADAVPLAATQPNAAPAAEVVADKPCSLCNGRGCYGTPGARCEWCKGTGKGLAAPAAAIDAREQEAKEAFQSWFEANALECGMEHSNWFCLDSEGDYILDQVATSWVAFRAGRTSQSHRGTGAREQDPDNCDGSSFGCSRECAGCELNPSRSEAPAARPNAAEQKQGWLPIATAPKDGRSVLIANDSPGSVHPREGYYVAPEHRYENEPKHEGWWRLAGSCEERVHGRTPTHWMPLPPPPLEAVGSSGMTADQAQGDKS